MEEYYYKNAIQLIESGFADENDPSLNEMFSITH
jgi:hypothetical protein